MTRQELIEQIRQKESYLCVGLDPDMSKLPKHLLKEKDPLFEFNRQIIEATYDVCVAYKPNTAFYEAYGLAGWESLEKVKNIIPEGVFTIADAKRGDIGNTSGKYAEAFLSGMKFDSITVNPYMGIDSVKPFLDVPGKWAILLGLTSNEGSNDFQRISLGNRELFEEIIEKSSKWGNDENMMYVIGATHPDDFIKVRKLIPSHFLLVPGVGAQGGDLGKISEAGLTRDCGLLVNASRSIIYASQDKDFAKAARNEAIRIKNEMSSYLNRLSK